MSYKLPDAIKPRRLHIKGDLVTWIRPTTLEELLELRAKYPQAKLVIGNTEIGNKPNNLNRILRWYRSICKLVEAAEWPRKKSDVVRLKFKERCSINYTRFMSSPYWYFSPSVFPAFSDFFFPSLSSCMIFSLLAFILWSCISKYQNYFIFAGIEVKFKNQNYPILIAPTHIPELNAVEHTAEGIRFGASVTLSTLEEVLSEACQFMPGI